MKKDQWFIELENKRCNGFTEDEKIIIGHDYGGAVWLRAVEVQNSDMITHREVKEIGSEISIDIHFFDEVLRPFFIENFDADMCINKNRYTYAFNEKGRYLTGFEENILEYNFFTYTQFTQILDDIEEYAKDTQKRSKRSLSETDAAQFMILSELGRKIMQENPATDLISVLS